MRDHKNVHTGLPPDGGLGEPKMKFEDTFSGEDAVLNEALACRIEAPLPQRVKNIDTGELMDAYSLHLSADDRRRLVAALRR